MMGWYHSINNAFLPQWVCANNVISLPDNGDLGNTLDVRNYVSKISDMSLNIVQVAVVLLLWVVVTSSILARVAQRTILSKEGVWTFIKWWFFTGFTSFTWLTGDLLYYFYLPCPCWMFECLASLHELPKEPFCQMNFYQMVVFHFHWFQLSLSLGSLVTCSTIFYLPCHFIECLVTRIVIDVKHHNNSAEKSA